VLVDAEYFRTLFDYHYWGRDRLLAAAEGLSAEEYGAPNGFSYDGLRPLFTHTVATEIAWLNRMRGESATRLEPATEEGLPTFEALVARWREVEAVQRAFLQTLRDEDLKTAIEYKLRDGTPTRATIWQLLTIVYTHSIQHRSEAAEALTMVGRSPGNLDYIVYMREKG
jgi:uncharacterized damage-inducible protein DinB